MKSYHLLLNVFPGEKFKLWDDPRVRSKTQLDFYNFIRVFPLLKNSTLEIQTILFGCSPKVSVQVYVGVQHGAPAREVMRMMALQNYFSFYVEQHVVRTVNKIEKINRCQVFTICRHFIGDK